jgi:hypothetical protein
MFVTLVRSNHESSLKSKPGLCRKRGLYFRCSQHWEDDNQRHIKAAFNFTECYGRFSAAHCVCTVVTPLGSGLFHGLKGLMIKKEFHRVQSDPGEQDSIESVAEALCHRGGMHGDLALVITNLSARALMNLVNLGVALPRDAYGQFAGNKADHDSRRRQPRSVHTRRGKCAGP